MNVHIDIERIVLDGLPLAPGEEARFRAALELELARRVAAHGLGAEALRGGALASLPPQPMSFPSGSTPAQLGRGVAAAIHQSLQPGAGRAEARPASTPGGSR